MKMQKVFAQSRDKLLRRLLMVAWCVVLCSGIAHAAPLTVTGTVTSASDGEPLIGVSVIVVGQTGGVTTDIDGNYSIKADMGADLQFSYVGMTTRVIKVTAARMDVALQDNAAALDEVVVVGYGVQKKKLVTGATSQIKGSEIAGRNTTGAVSALQGQMPGVTITSNTGQPGDDAMKVTIRGLGTNGSATPLYVIDGVPSDQSAAGSINPSDIESIDVLKDAASAAIYGAQAANGVVLITTKSGKEGRTTVTFDGYYGWQTLARKSPMLNAQQYMTILDEQAINSGAAPYDWDSYKSIWRYDADGNRLGVIDTDWIDEMVHNGAGTQNYTVGISGGSATNTYAVSLGYTNQEGLVGGPKVSNYSRYNFRANLEQKAFDGILTVGEQVAFTYSKNRNVGTGGTDGGSMYNNALYSAFGTSPLSPVYDADGNYNSTSNSDWQVNDGNPVGALMNTFGKTKKAVFTGNIYAQLEPIKNLRIRTLLGTQYGNSNYRSFTPIYNWTPNNNNTVTKVQQNSSNWLNLTWTNTISYDWKIKEHEFSALLGMEAYRSSGSYLEANNSALKDGYDDWAHAWITNTTGTSENGMSMQGRPNDDERRVSYFGRIGWNWQEKYMVNFTLRNDGSSHFARGHRHGWFPSVSAGWNLSSESFMEPTQNWLSYFKLRASWGLVGNQNIPNYRYLAPIEIRDGNYYFGQYLGPNGAYDTGYAGNTATNWGAYPSRLGNENLTWETSEQTDLGFDAAFLHNRLNVNFDFYIKTTRDWLVPAPVLATFGAEAPYINGGDVKNTGVELNLSWNDVIGRDFSYNVGFNIAYNKNKVGNIPTSDGIIHGRTNIIYENQSPEVFRAENGHAIGYFWGLQTAGIFQNQQQINDWIAAGNGVLQDNVAPGDVIFVDRNHDGKIDDTDRTDLGNGMPKINYGFNINLYYKNFDLGVILTGVAGNKILQSYTNHKTWSNYTTEILDRWTGEGTSNKIPRVTNDYVNWAFSDLYLHDGDYLRISNLTIGYNFAPLMKQKWCSNARLYFQVQNLYTFTKYNGMDPEIGYGTDPWVSGIDLGFYPHPRTYMVGVNLAF